MYFLVLDLTIKIKCGQFSLNFDTIRYRILQEHYMQIKHDLHNYTFRDTMPFRIIHNHIAPKGLCI